MLFMLLELGRFPKQPESKNRKKVTELKITEKLYHIR